MLHNYETKFPPKVYDGPPPHDALQMENGDWVWLCECGVKRHQFRPAMGALGCQPPPAKRRMPRGGRNDACRTSVKAQCTCDKLS